MSDRLPSGEASFAQEGGYCQPGNLFVIDVDGIVAEQLICGMVVRRLAWVHQWHKSSRFAESGLRGSFEMLPARTMRNPKTSFTLWKQPSEWPIAWAVVSIGDADQQYRSAKDAQLDHAEMQIPPRFGFRGLAWRFARWRKR